MNAINYWHLMTIIKEADEEEAPADDSSGADLGISSDSGSSSVDSKPKENSNANKININKMTDELFKKKIVHLVDYFVSVILNDKMYFGVNKNISKFLSSAIENLNELLKSKINKSFSQYIQDKTMDTQIIQNIIDSFSFIRLKNDTNIDNVFLVFNKKNIFKFFFEKGEKGYRLSRVDLADLSYTKQQIRNDIFKFISDSIFNYKKENK